MFMTVPVMGQVVRVRVYLRVKPVGVRAARGYMTWASTYYICGKTNHYRVV